MPLPRTLALFGGSEPAPGDPLYERARRIGALAARAGAGVVTGGYGGVMEAASLGAREAGGEAIGVVCAAFEGRRPNAHLTRVIEEPDLFARTRRLVELASGFIILPGRSGTLAELTFLWALRRSGLLGPAPVVLLGDGWAALLEALRAGDLLEPAAARETVLARSEEEAVGLALGGGAG